MGRESGFLPQKSSMTGFAADGRYYSSQTYVMTPLSLQAVLWELIFFEMKYSNRISGRGKNRPGVCCPTILIKHKLRFTNILQQVLRYQSPPTVRWPCR